MKLLLDTHVLLWWLNGETRLKQGAFASIADEANQISISSISLWEIEIKQAKGKLGAPPELIDRVREQDFAELPLTFEHAVTAGRLPPHHRDPFDRALIAQAQVESATLISDDSVFERYPVNVMRASAA